MWKAVTIVTAMIAVGAVAVSVLCLVKTGDLSNTLHRDQAIIRFDTSELSQQGLQLSQLKNSVNGLTVPSDPLSAYTNICTSVLTNDATGIAQTYYYPCTNNAQTIPQPGT